MIQLYLIVIHLSSLVHRLPAETPAAPGALPAATVREHDGRGESVQAGPSPIAFQVFTPQSAFLNPKSNL